MNFEIISDINENYEQLYCMCRFFCDTNTIL